MINTSGSLRWRLTHCRGGGASDPASLHSKATQEMHVDNALNATATLQIIRNIALLLLLLLVLLVVLLVVVGGWG